MTATPQTRAVALVLSGLLGLGVTACSQDPERARADETPRASLTVHEAPTLESLGVVRLGTVRGRLPKRDRERLLEQVSHTVDQWLRGAYLEGDYPRNDFRAGFAAFTPGARRQARADKKLLSNAGARITAVRPRARRLAVDAVAVRGRAVGATARVRLVFDASGKQDRTVIVRGRVFLTRTKQGWQIFGYDVSRGTA